MEFQVIDVVWVDSEAIQKSAKEYKNGEIVDIIPLNIYQAYEKPDLTSNVDGTQNWYHTLILEGVKLTFTCSIPKDFDPGQEHNKCHYVIRKIKGES